MHILKPNKRPIYFIYLLLTILKEYCLIRKDGRLVIEEIIQFLLNITNIFATGKKHMQSDHHSQNNLNKNYSSNKAQQLGKGQSYCHIDDEQLKHRAQVKTSFVNYGKDLRQTFADIFSTQKLPKYFELARERKKQCLEKAIDCNQKFLNQIIDYINYQESENSQVHKFQPLQITSCHNIPKIRTTVKQFYRQWCSQSPQAKNYKLLVEKAKQYFQKEQKILVPGCGLGRLVLELVQAGFGVQGNQVTYFMLYGSNFILNCCSRQEEFQIYPFIHTYTNMSKEDDIFRSVKIPDKVASKVVSEDSDFSMAAGQFTQIYGKQTQTFKGIISCFFLDTANNIFQYIDTIYTILEKGGIWINYGPLLFHYKDMLDQVSIEISWQQLQKYIKSKGLSLVQEQMQKTTYCHDPLSCYTHQYNCLMSIWKKD